MPISFKRWSSKSGSACRYERRLSRKLYGAAHRLQVAVQRHPIRKACAAAAAIDPSEDAVSIDAAIAMRKTFAQDSPAVRAFFDALMKLLTVDGRKQ